ncbi:hypothetical protein BDR22DRAFT_373614 [Usnea florida]
MITTPPPPSFLPLQPHGDLSVISTSPHQHAVPAQRVQHCLLGQPHIDADSNLDTGRSPSLDQQYAVAILQRFSNPTVSALFADFHSSRDYSFLAGGLSLQERNALSSLEYCPEPLVFRWINLARSRGISITSQDRRSTGFGPQRLPGALDPYQASSNNPQPSTALLDGPPFFRTDPTICGTSSSQCDPIPYVDRPGSVPSLGQGPGATAPNDHVHWCVVCEDPGEIRTCDGFKRHMREHETRFYCMLKGPVVETENGPKCAFCNVLHPDREHLGTHNIHICMNKSPADRSYSRKELLTKHLKHHGIVEASTLADQWRYTANKKYFACGFCGSYHDSLVEQINHIDHMHYRLSEHINNWDSNKAIRGLLSQPGMRNCWQTLLATKPYLQESSLTWTPTLAKTLQSRLERSEETAEILFTAAIDQSNYGRSDPGFADPQMSSSQSMQTLPHRPLWSPLPSDMDCDSITHVQALPLINPSQQSQQLAQHRILDSTVSKRHLHSGCPTKPRFPPDSGENVMQLPLSFQAPTIEQHWASPIGSRYNSGFGGISPVFSPSLTTSSHHWQGAEGSRPLGQVPTQNFDPALAAEQFARPDEQLEGYDNYGLNNSSNRSIQRIVQGSPDTRRRRRPH